MTTGWGEKSCPAAVVAGFIRYTEVLTAMDDLFPAVDSRKHELEQRSVLGSIRIREALAEEIKDIIRWRIPDTSQGLAAYRTVRATFLQIVSDHFHQHPNSDLQWSPVGTYSALIRLADRFFGLKESRVSEAGLDRIARMTATSEESVARIQKEVQTAWEEAEKELGTRQHGDDDDLPLLDI